MLTENEKKFIAYWEYNREVHSTFSSKLLRGFPMALLFSLPIILLVLVVKLYFPEWYTKISKTSPGMFVTAIFAVLLIALFYAFFRMHAKWENNEQVYISLKKKEAKANAGNNSL